MREKGLFCAMIVAIFAISLPAAAVVDYMLYDNYGGTWCDAEKTASNTQDDLMCWAASASNVLEWTGWGNVAGMTNTDQMFSYFQNHWTDKGGMMEYGWDWWFDGTNNSTGWSGWSDVDVAGGGFYPTENFGDYFHSSSNDSVAMATIAGYLSSGYGTTIAVYGPGGHAITVWGYKYGLSSSDYLGIWVSDSDDDKGGDGTRPNSLRYYDVSMSGGKWYLESFYGSNDWYIGVVQGLAGVVQNLATVPEPATILLFGLSGLVILRKRKA